MRYLSRDLDKERFLGRFFLWLGVLVLSQGLAAVSLALLGYAAMAGKALVYAPFTIVGGIGLIGWGWTTIREAAAIEREHALRIERFGEARARTRGGGARSRARSVEAAFRSPSEVPDPKMSRDFPSLYRSF